MRFSQLAQYFHQLESVSGRLEMTEILAKLFAEASQEDIDKIIYLSLGRLGPQYDTTEFQMAAKMVIRSLALAYESSDAEVTKLYKKLGDVGSVVQQLAENSKLETRNSKLSVSKVYEGLLKIATDEGQGSQDRKVQALASLLQSVDPLSAKYLARIPVGKLRLGFSDMTILDALSWMVAGDKSLHSDLENAYNISADVGKIAQNIKYQISKINNTNQKLKINKVKKSLNETKIQLGTPLIAGLCQRLKSFDEMIDKMGEVDVEPKYDGTRLQIHWKRKDSCLRTFTRNLEENTHMFPELETIGKQLKGEAYIFDCEAVGYDPKTGKSLPFQMTISRKRKHGIEEQRSKVALKFKVFDVMYAEETKKQIDKKTKDQKTKNHKTISAGDIHDLPLSQRRKILESAISGPGPLEAIRHHVTSDPKTCRELHKQYLEEGLEGVVVKKWSGAYVPGRKGWNWVKMKEVETARAGLSDTLDCVVMGYYRGRGQRAKFGLGAFLVGILLTERNKVKSKSGTSHPFDSVSHRLGKNYLTVSKIGTGLSDDQFRDLAKRLKPLETKQMPSEYGVHKNLAPDVWVRPSLVVEIAADNITKSPTHTARLALRFPRLVKFRDDKSPAQATTLKELQHLYMLQN